MGVPYQKHSETSKAAAEYVEPKAGSRQAKIYQFLLQCGEDGATDQEIQKALRMNGNSERPGRVSLVKSGLVVDSGKKRSANRRTGTLAVVWVAKREHKPSKIWKLPHRTMLPCPACDQETFFVVDSGGMPIRCDPQRRLIVFTEEAIASIPKDALTLFEETTGKLVCGRPANEEEREYYKNHKTLDGVVPWTIGVDSHLKTCPRGDLWADGTAQLREKSIVFNRTGSASYALSIGAARKKIMERNR